MITILRLAAFILSNVGMWELFRRRTKINIYFLPSLTIAVQVSLLFIAGILNVLKESTILLWLFGVIYLCIVIIKDKSIKFLKNYLNAGYIFCAFTMVVMLLFVRGKIFTHYDNFSHWAMVVKRMIETNRFPNFEDTIIMFQEYPLGSSTYIYYFSKIISSSESMQMLAQIYMMTTCIMPIFIFGEKNKMLTLIAVLSFTNFFFVYNITITNLLVDTLLPIVSMCALIFVYMYSGNAVKENQEAFYFMAAYLIQIIQIKNSGIYFIFIAVIWILYKGKKAKDYPRRIIPILLPFLSLILWQKHCKYVFSSPETSKHAMTADNYKLIFNSKSVEDIKAICKAMIKFSVTYKDVWIAFGVVLAAGFIIVCICKEYKRFWRKTFIFSLILYASYQVGVLGMYLFSMPVGEATSLDSSTRYAKTILIAIVYIAAIVYVRIISHFEIKTYIPAAITVLTVLLPVIYMKMSLGEVRAAVQYKDSPEERNWIEQAKKEYEVPNGESYCILTKDGDYGYAYYLGVYIFQTNDIETMLVKDEADMDNINSKYIFVYDLENSIVQNWIQHNYSEQVGNKVIIREKE